MHAHIDPSTVQPMPGKMVVQIVEVLGGMTRGGIFIPGTTQDHMGKDTCLVKVLAKGAPPMSQYRRGGDGSVSEVRTEPWPESYRTISVGDVVVMPRDMPCVFVWEDKRYAIVNEFEAIVSMPGEEFDQQVFEVVPWRAGPVGGPSVEDSALAADLANDRDLLEP